MFKKFDFVAVLGDFSILVLMRLPHNKPPKHQSIHGIWKRCWEPFVLTDAETINYGRYQRMPGQRSLSGQQRKEVSHASSVDRSCVLSMLKAAWRGIFIRQNLKQWLVRIVDLVSSTVFTSIWKLVLNTCWLACEELFSSFSFSFLNSLSQLLMMLVRQS